MTQEYFGHVCDDCDIWYEDFCSECLSCRDCCDCEVELTETELREIDQQEIDAKESAEEFKAECKKEQADIQKWEDEREK